MQNDRDQIYLNYVTKGPNVIANISRKFYCCVLYIVCTIYSFLKSKIKINTTSNPIFSKPTVNTLSLPETHFWIQVYIIANIAVVCTMRHRLKPSCQNKKNNLTGSSEFRFKSLLPVNWQQPFHRKIAATS